MTIGVLVMAYGSPGSTEEIGAYYTHIRGGRAPEAPLLEDLERRYAEIGGVSAMTEHTLAQVNAITAALGKGFVVQLGQKHSAPFIEDGVNQLASASVDRIAGLVLAPHYSASSLGQYLKRAAAAAAAHAIPFQGIESWHLLEELLDFNAAAVTNALAPMPRKTKVIFTAHSLPERALHNDPYPDQLHDSAAAVAQRANLATWAGWGLGWQSASRSPTPWRGPDISVIIRDLAETGRSEGILVCPQGFTSEHMEVRHDLDIVARQAAADVGLQFGRTDLVNADATVMSALAQLVSTAARSM